MAEQQSVRGLPSLSVFFPAYNEEGNIPALTKTTVGVLEEMGADYEIIIVNDGSTDRTGKVAERLAGIYPGVRVIHHENNLGYGAALKTGFTNAKNDYIFYTDGDSQYDVRDMRKFVALVGLSDVVIGCRYQKQYTLYRKITSFTYDLIVQVFFGLPYRDVNCSFKLFPKRFIEQISIDSVKLFVDAELLIKAQRLDQIITEVGVTHYPRETGAVTVNTKVIFDTIKEMNRFYPRMRPEKRKSD